MDIEQNSQQDQQDEEFEFIATNVEQSQDQIFFNHVVSLLQEIVISPEFQKKIQQFMNQNWQNIDDSHQPKLQDTFNKFSSTFISYLSQKLSTQIPHFEMSYFIELLKTRRDQVDEQLLDTLESLSDINCFGSFIKDSKTSHDQVETYKILTIKSNKIAQNKTVKGKDNIFGNSNPNPLFEIKMKKPLKTVKQEKLIEKTEDQLLVPDLVLTVKGIRKG